MVWSQHGGDRDPELLRCQSYFDPKPPPPRYLLRRYDNNRDAHCDGHEYIRDDTLPGLTYLIQSDIRLACGDGVARKSNEVPTFLLGTEPPMSVVLGGLLPKCACHSYDTKSWPRLLTLEGPKLALWTRG